MDLYFVLLFTDSQQPDNVNDENAEPKYEDLDIGMSRLPHAEQKLKNGSSENSSDSELATKRPQKYAPPQKPEQNSSNNEYDYAAVDGSGLALDIDCRSKQGYVNVK